MLLALPKHSTSLASTSHPDDLIAMRLKPFNRDVERPVPIATLGFPQAGQGPANHAVLSAEPFPDRLKASRISNDRAKQVIDCMQRTLLTLLLLYQVFTSPGHTPEGT